MARIDYYVWVSPPMRMWRDPVHREKGHVWLFCGADLDGRDATEDDETWLAQWSGEWFQVRTERGWVWPS